MGLGANATSPELTWLMHPDIHPMVTAGEKFHVQHCLQMLRDLIQAEGGLSRYCAQSLQQLLPPDAYGGAEPAHRAILELEVGPELLRNAFEVLLQEQSRTGGDSVFVQTGLLMSFGSKKLMKLRLSYDTWETDVSVCWDWDVKLEPRSLS